MKFIEALEQMKSGIPVRHEGMKHGEFIAVIDNELRRISSDKSYSFAYTMTLEDYDAEWHTVTHDEWNKQIDLAVKEAKTFFEAISLMTHGFICGIKDDPEETLYAIHEKALGTIEHDGSFKECKPSAWHLDASWYVVGYPQTN